MLLKSLLVLATAAGFAAEMGSTPGRLTVHEWGTFTSVAGPDGSPVNWTPLSGPSDLPCFVNRRGLVNVKSAGALVRMETPVLYFYAPRPVTLSVHVAFPQGLISEWYPRASRVVPETANINTQHSEILWDRVQVSPGEDLKFPTGAGASHYYAARNTDAAPLRIGDQQEKLLFYRGVGSFPIPVHPTFTPQGRLRIRNTGGEPIPALILFESRAGKTGFRMVRGVDQAVELDTPELTGDATLLRNNLVDALADSGLFRKEAEAMVETWRDSWFEEGMRVFYLVPRGTVDSLLPLTIQPAPTQVERVFVGRVEVLSPETRRALEAAVVTGDVPVLEKYGRFVDPFLWQLRQGRELVIAHATNRFLEARYGAAARERNAPACVE